MGVTVKQSTARMAVLENPAGMGYNRSTDCLPHFPRRYAHRTRA